MAHVYKLILISCFLVLFAMPAHAQYKKNRPYNSIGVRFASDFNYFLRADENDLVDNWFSTGVFGLFYRSYSKNKGIEIGLNVNYKNSSGKGVPNFPVIMKDFGAPGPQNVGMTALELDVKVGPRYKGFHPKIGYILGYRIFHDGFLEDGSDMKINRLYFQLPFGASLALPTNFGAVGFGMFYELDLSNVMGNDGSVTRGGIFNGSHQHAVNAEINVTFDTRP